MQNTLSSKQLEAFYHDEFVEDQTRDFLSLVGVAGGGNKVVADIGGGCGFFAKRICHLSGHKVRVIDMDAASVEACRGAGIEAVRGDALNPQIVGDENIVSFNLVLHHLVGASEQVTFELQRKALAVWRAHVSAVFVNEYIYESYVGNLSGWLIFQITKSRVLSWIGRMASIVMPSLKANTFGVGVRFRAHQEWVRVFASAGYDVKARKLGEQEYISLPRRLLLIRRICRDSFLLQPHPTR
jgi:hypothetical protein